MSAESQSTVGPSDQQEEQEEEKARKSSHEEPQTIQEGTELLYGGSNIAAACAATNAVARPQVDLTDEQQRTKRLQMNRANAQRNRDRKRIMIDMLQNEKSQLIETNAALKKQNAELGEAIKAIKLRLRTGIGDKTESQSDKDPSSETKAELGRVSLEIQSEISDQPCPPATNPFSYRTNVVNAVARDLLLQEQLLANRLSHAPQVMNRQPRQPFLSSSEGLLNDRLESADNIQSQLSLGMVPNHTSMLFPPSLSIQQPLFGGFPYGGQRGLGLVGAPPLRLDSPFQVPARSALLSSITPRLDDSLSSVSASTPKTEGRGLDEDREATKGKLS